MNRLFAVPQFLPRRSTLMFRYSSSVRPDAIDQSTRFIVLLLLFASGVHAAELPKSAAAIDWRTSNELTPEQRSALPWYCSGTYVEPIRRTTSGRIGTIDGLADQVNQDQDGDIEMRGDVVVWQQGRQLEAQEVFYNRAEQSARTIGPLRLREDGLLITGSNATSDLDKDNAIINDASFLIHNVSIRGEARQLERLANKHLLIHEGRFTRCDPGSNVWGLASPRIELEPETGFGTARNVKLELGGVPVLWFPYLRFPIDDERHGGFLMPSAGYDSTGGTDLIAPYYINIAPQMDATWEVRSLWQRGLIHRNQFRLKTRHTNNEINTGIVFEDQRYDPRNLVDLTMDSNTEADIPAFEAQDRWMLNVRHSGEWLTDLTSSINYSAVSDIDYLSDIGGDVGSSHIDAFIGPIDQNLNNRLSASLDRKGDITYQQGGFTAALQVQAFQPLTLNARPQYGRLPRLYSRYHHDVAGLNMELQAEHTWFDRDHERFSGIQAVTGERTVGDLTVAYPLRTSWGFAIPSAGATHRSYRLDQVPDGLEASPDRTDTWASLDTGLIFDRFFRWRERDWLQTLEPRVYYLYANATDQSDLPQFDAGSPTPSLSQLFRHNRFSGWDRINDANLASISMTSRLVARETGNQWASVSLGQQYYFSDREVLYRDRDPRAATRGSSPLFAEIRLSPFTNMSMAARVTYDANARQANRSNVTFRYTPDNRRIVSLSYLHTHPDIQPVQQFRNSEETDLGIIWPIKGPWSLIGRWNFGWTENQTIDYFAGIEYNDCCWKSRLVLRRFVRNPQVLTILTDNPESPGDIVTEDQTVLPHDTVIFVEFQMKGLATIGERLDLLLEQTLPGYRAREDDISR
ncbi:MAG: hypothetical protein CMQ05_07785 [Gammaproteobacteria bacterium]|nr:hypothetical protein [Gammaproteobacteria bacterium]RPG27538.1 MAG: LPS-assembly protein LptD [Gammaproteobacteria bacterium TMED50]